MISAEPRVKRAVQCSDVGTVDEAPRVSHIPALLAAFTAGQVLSFEFLSYSSSFYLKMSSRWEHPSVWVPRAAPGGTQGPAFPQHGGERPRQQPRGQRLLRVEWRSDAGQLANFQLGVDKSGGIRRARPSDCSQEVLLK